MVCIAQDDLRTELQEFARADGFHACLCPDRHERRRLNHAMAGRDSAAPRFRRRIFFEEFEHAGGSLRRRRLIASEQCVIFGR
jgi:hypothetical protein